MSRAIDIAGKKYGKLTAIAATDEITANGTLKWRFLCECGEEYIARKSHVTSGEMSCCITCQKRMASVKSTVHGLTYNPNGERSKVFQAWINIKKRCYNVKDKAYPRYGGRGILMQDEWVNDPKAFVDYLGEAPSEEYSVERIDNNKGYVEGNICWAKNTTQARNRSGRRVELPSCVYLTKDSYKFKKKIFGKSVTVSFYFMDDDLSKELALFACTEYRNLIFERMNKTLPEGERYSERHGSYQCE